MLLQKKEKGWWVGGIEGVRMSKYKLQLTLTATARQHLIQDKIKDPHTYVMISSMPPSVFILDDWMVKKQERGYKSLLCPKTQWISQLGKKQKHPERMWYKPRRTWPIKPNRTGKKEEAWWYDGEDVRNIYLGWKRNGLRKTKGEFFFFFIWRWS